MRSNPVSPLASMRKTRGRWVFSVITISTPGALLGHPIIFRNTMPRIWHVIYNLILANIRRCSWSGYIGRVSIIKYRISIILRALLRVAQIQGEGGRRLIWRRGVAAVAGAPVRVNLARPPAHAIALRKAQGAVLNLIWPSRACRSSL